VDLRQRLSCLYSIASLLCADDVLASYQLGDEAPEERPVLLEIRT